QLEQKARYDDAIAIYTSVVQNYPATAAARFCRAHAAILGFRKAVNAGDYVQARQHAQTLRTADVANMNDAADWVASTGIQFENKGQYDDALEVYRYVAQKYPTTEAARVARAHIAILEFQKAVNAGDYVQARQHAQTLRTDFTDMTDTADWVSSTGIALENKGQYDDALEVYRYVAQNYPTTAAARVARAHTAILEFQKAINSGDYVQARQHAQTLRAADFADMNDVAVWVGSTGVEFENKGQYDDALAAYRYVTQKYPATAAARVARAHTAILEFQKAVNAGDYVQARQHAQTLRATDVADMNNTADWICSAGNQFESKLQYADALVQFRYVIEKYPTTAAARFCRARAASLAFTDTINAGNYEQARLYARTLKTDFKTMEEIPDQLYWAGCQFLIKSLHEDANGIFNTIVTDYPQSIAAKYAAAQLLAGRVVPTIEQLSDEGLSSALMALQGNSLAKDAETVALARFFIAESYFEVGMRHTQSGPDPNNVFFTRSLSLFQSVSNGVIGQTETKATVQYMIGLNCDKLGSYLNASQAFAKAYGICPNHPHADYLLFAQGYCYEKLMSRNAVAAPDAKTIITTQYSRLISAFPQSQYTPYAKSWLENDSK
ncbi:MAG: tetratricopeptide repeat protein, partial [Sideroxyarcus sp.]|nr:tetratricopeptide repeat protein [Sideroxyarcus sp.]